MVLIYLKTFIFIFRLIFLKLYLTKIEKLSFKIFKVDSSKVKYFPIDREAIEPYINEIIKLNYINFITFNFKCFPEKYTHKLMVCLPEIFEKITYQDLVKITNNFFSPISIISFLNFTQSYLGVNSLIILKHSNIPKSLKKQIQNNFNKTNDGNGPINVKFSQITKERQGVEFSDFKNALTLFNKTVPKKNLWY